MNNDYIKVKDNKDLVRDGASGAILNLNNKAYEAFKKKRQDKLDTINTLEQHSNDISTIKQDMNEIKDLLRLLVKDL